MNSNNQLELSFEETNNKPKWHFLSVPESYEKKGLNDSGVETFMDDSFRSLAREICQNSLDAAIANTSPVIVEFHCYSQPSIDFPDRNTLVDAFKKAQAFWSNEGIDETVRYFQEAESTLLKEEIKWMRISDFNTFGLQGVEKPANAQGTTPWSSLVMSSGVSNKPGDAGGSFGIGKFATFSCSAIRTCFYSTITDESHRGAQGVSRIVSFKNDDEITLGIGYYRNNGNPLDDILPLDPSFSRTTPGTDIFVPAFLPNESWIQDVQKAVLEGFLYAIFNKKLIVKLIDGSNEPITMNREWLDHQFNAETLPDDTVRQNYQALILDKNDNIFKKSFDEDGYIELRLLIEPNLDHRIAMIRGTGMKIFGKGNFPSSISFSGVLIVHGEKLNKRIKSLENPQHTKWEPKRDKADKKLYEAIISFCRESLKKLVNDSTPEETGANLGDVLPASGETANAENREVLSPKIKPLQKKKRIKKRRIVHNSNSPDDDSSSSQTEASNEIGGDGQDEGQINNEPPSDNSHNRDNDHENNNDNNKTSEEGNQKKTVFKAIEAGSSRFICLDEQKGIYRMLLVPKKQVSNAAVSINAVAELNTYSADIISAELSDGTTLTLEGNRISGFDFQKGQVVQINLKMNYSEYVSLEVEWYGSM